jgi:virginiamycin A acetyltransferase
MLTMTVMKKEGRRVPVLGALLFHLYRAVSSDFLRGKIRWMVLVLEGGEYHSLTIRRIFSMCHARDVGLYSAGASFVLDAFQPGLPGTVIGRFCSLTPSIKAYSVNHPVEWRSTHAFFYNPSLGQVDRDLLLEKRTRLTIGNDVWIGHNAILLPSVSSVGDGAVIAAGSVVFQNVPPYAIVGGYPARIIRYRFSPAMIEQLLASKWWEDSIEDIGKNLDSFQKPLE